MMHTKFLMMLLRLFSSCNPMLRIPGKIISDKTGESIEGATIELLYMFSQLNHNSAHNDYPVVLSDKNGNFSAASRIAKIKLDLSKYQIRIFKSGYDILQAPLMIKGRPGICLD
jgi:hypothetical protein